MHNKGADIDTLCVAPRHILREDYFSSFLGESLTPEFSTNVQCCPEQLWIQSTHALNCFSQRCFVWPTRWPTSGLFLPPAFPFSNSASMASILTCSSPGLIHFGWNKVERDWLANFQAGFEGGERRPGPERPHDPQEPGREVCEEPQWLQGHWWDPASSKLLCFAPGVKCLIENFIRYQMWATSDWP